VLCICSLFDVIDTNKTNLVILISSCVTCNIYGKSEVEFNVKVHSELVSSYCMQKRYRYCRVSLHHVSEKKHPLILLAIS